MKVNILITSSFSKAAKPLLKRYPSLKEDMLKLATELQNNPKLGTPLGHSAFKIRLRISSKAKGNSGGARIISLVETIVVGELRLSEQMINVNLLTIYDKADVAGISNKELRELIKAFNQAE